MTKTHQNSVYSIGYIGLGVMGSRMCRNLAEKSGKKVLGYDIDPAKVAALEASGVIAAQSVAGITSSVDILFMCLPGEPQVRDIAFGPDGLLSHVKEGQIIVDMSTTTVEISRELAAALEEKGARFADAPVARGVPAAENGTLAITVGASDAVLAEIMPYLECMGTEISHCGGVGNGQVMKLLNNMVLFHNVSALAEAMAIATRAGVERSKVFEILSRGSADSYAMRKHGTHMTSGDYPDDQFPLTYSVKDLSYAMSLAETVGVDASHTKLTMDRFNQAVDLGYGKYYSPVVYKLYDETSGN